MSAGRRIAALIAAVSALVAVPVPAFAHGAPTNPLSRSAACGPEGGGARGSAACEAARAAGFAAWDNLRVAGVAGRDRQVVPDGELCSGGLPAYKGLDLPREDWPSTTLKPGATITSTYRGTIAHPGEFRMYVTRAGYDPGAPLTWDDLEAKPFFAVTDPPFRNGSYAMRVTLPADLTGHHLIYTVWENTGPDTYYSCSDVIFEAPAKPSPAAEAAKPSPSAPSPSPAGSSPAESSAAEPSASPSAGGPAAVESETAPPTNLVASRSGTGTPLMFTLVAAGLMVLLAAVAVTLLVRRRTRRSTAG
ncbi:lytic polysaccharide monooxygenase [Catenuloplanes sp. NPDC051500]|uniref:lytic polysaccharide monooxygenase auxiliary activity family 9 protein n=1 Tax=Catenuloplanes sp. NPDC051500 TaxID=3363959 RepID=UPI0037B657B0